jgi:hypothetical protein
VAQFGATISGAMKLHFAGRSSSGTPQAVVASDPAAAAAKRRALRGERGNTDAL